MQRSGLFVIVNVMSGVIHALGGLGGGDVVVAGEVANVTPPPLVQSVGHKECEVVEAKIEVGSGLQTTLIFLAVIIVVDIAIRQTSPIVVYVYVVLFFVCSRKPSTAF